MIQVSGLQHAESAELLLCFRERTIRDDHLAVLPPQGLCGRSALKRLPAVNPVSTLEKLVVVGETLFDYGLLLAFGLVAPGLLLTVSKANELHGSLLDSGALIGLNDFPW